MRTFLGRLGLAAVVLSLLAGALIAPAGASTTAGPVLTGRLVDQAGNAVAGAQISLIYQLQPADKVSGRCLTQPRRRTVCGSFTWAVTTTPDGSWRMSLPAGQPVSSPGQHGLWPEISAPTSARGYAITFMTLAWDGRSKNTGTQVLWEPDLTVTRSGTRALMHLTLPPGTQGPGTVELLQGDDPVWTATPASDGTVSVDEHALEGVTGVRARAHGYGTQWNTWTAPAPDFGVPLSRGMACSTYLTDNTLAALRTCSYTDSNLLMPETEPAARRDYPANTCWGGCPTPDTLVFTLNGLTKLDAVVWRDCQRCTLEVSLDGNTWISWPGQQQEGSAYAILTGAALPITAVRIHGSGHTYADLAEVSIWGTPLA